MSLVTVRVAGASVRPAVPRTGDSAPVATGVTRASVFVTALATGESGLATTRGAVEIALCTVCATDGGVSETVLALSV